MPKFSTTLWLTLLSILAGVCLLLAGERVQGIAVNSAKLSLAAASIAVPFGTLLAVVLTKTNVPGRRWGIAAFAVLLFVPLYLHAAGWQAALGVGGWMTVVPAGGLAKPWIDGWRGAIWIHAMAAVPWVVCIVAAGLRRLPADAEEAALLVVPAWRVLWSVTLPAARPAIVIATLWTVVSIAAEMTVTDFFQIRTFAEEVYTVAAAGGFQTDNPQVDYAAWSPWLRNTGLIAGVGLLASLTAMVLLSVMSQLASLADSPAERIWRCHLGQPRWLAAIIPAAGLLLVAGAPIASLIHKAGLGTEQTGSGWHRVWSLGQLQSQLTSSVALHDRELWQTVLLGFAVATVATLLGVIWGWHLRTSRRMPVVSIALLSLALSVPGPLLGLGAIELLNHPTGSFLSPLTRAYDQTLLAPWLVQMVRFTPVATLVMAAAFASLPAVLLDSAKTDGVGWWGTLLRIALRSSIAMLIVAWLITFSLSAGELAATVLVMPPGTPTLTIRLFALLHYGVEDQVAGISLVFLAALAVVASIAVGLVSFCRRREGNVL